MQYRELGSSGMRVSALAFGAWQLGDPGYWGAAASEETAVAGVAIDSGINLFDTAEMYGGGESERVLGKALGARRDEVLVASKVMPDHCAPKQLRAACEASLRRLGTDRIDLYQVHWPFRHVPFADAYGELMRLKQEGKIRAIGASNFGPRDLDAWNACGGGVSNQVGYNLLFRAVEYEIIPACRATGMGVLAYMPLLQGILTGRWRSIEEIPENRRRTRHFASRRPGTRHGEDGCETLVFDALRRLDDVAGRLGCPLAQLALAWLMAQPGVTSVIVGARKKDQLTRNLPAADITLDAAVLQELDAITLPVKQHLGPNADMWMAGENSRIR